MKVKKPCGHRILVKLKNVDKVSAGGIILPDLDRRQAGTEMAYVVQLGDQAFKGFHDGSPWCQVGDLVEIVQYSGVLLNFKIGGELHRLINDEDVICVLEEENDHE